MTLRTLIALCLAIGLISCTTYSPQQDAEQFYSRMYNKAKRDCFKDGWAKDGDWSPACQKMIELRQDATEEILAHQTLAQQRGQALLGAAIQLQGRPPINQGMTCTEYAGITRCF